MTVDVIILGVSIAIRLAALVWSLFLWRRTRDWRLLLLSAMLALATVRQMLTPGGLGNETAGSAAVLAELSDLAVSLLGLLFVAVLDRLLSRSRLHDTLIESAVDAVVRLSPDGTFAFLNPAFEEITGCKRKDWLGRSFVDLVHPADREQAEELLAMVLDGAVLPRPELRIVTPHGDVVVGEFALTPEVSSGRLTGVLAIARDITEPKKAEARLRRLERRYRYLFRDAPAMYVLALVKGNELLIDDCNQSFLDKLGYTREEVLGRDVADFYTPASRADLLDENDFAHTVVGRAVAHERQLQTKSGAVLDTLLRARPERDGDGAVVGTLAMYVDVTASKRAARERDDALAKFESIAHHVPDCFWSTVFESDGSPRVAYVSPGWKKIWGYEPEEIYQNAELWVECVLAEDRVLAQQAFDRTAAEKNTQTATYRIRSKSGAVRWVEDEMSPILDPSGNVVGLDGIARDTTERKKTEDALKRSEERYRELFEDSLDAIYVSSPDGKIVTINRRGLELFGYDSIDQIEEVGQLYRDRADRDHLLALVAEHGELKDHELRLQKKDGTPLRVLVSLRAIRGPEGSIIALQGILRDISEQHELERQLARSQRLDAIGRLAGGIAHDFNNLLTIIIGYLELARGKTDSGEAIDTELDGIQASSDRAAALVRQLLVFSRQHKLEPVVLDLNEIVDGMRGLLERTLSAEIDLAVDLADERLRILADPSQVEQVLINLVVNAREAMPAGGALTVATAARTLAGVQGRDGQTVAAGSYVELTVADTGLGMDAATREHIFEPFFTTKSAADNSGLGLSTCFGIIEQSGGFINVESEEGNGTIFRVLVPAASVDLDSSPNQVSAQPAQPTRTGSQTLLVVEDEGSLLDLVVQALSRGGYSVIRANSGSIASEMLKDESLTIDLMVTDIVLPGVGGLELIREATRVRPTMKILAMSGYAGDAHPEGDLEVPFLAKPFTAEALAEKVREVLSLN